MKTGNDRKQIDSKRQFCIAPPHLHYPLAAQQALIVKQHLPYPARIKYIPKEQTNSRLVSDPSVIPFIPLTRCVELVHLFRNLPWILSRSSEGISWCWVRLASFWAPVRRILFLIFIYLNCENGDMKEFRNHALLLAVILHCGTSISMSQNFFNPIKYSAESPPVRYSFAWNIILIRSFVKAIADATGNSGLWTIFQRSTATAQHGRSSVERERVFPVRNNSIQFNPIPVYLWIRYNSDVYKVTMKKSKLQHPRIPVFSRTTVLRGPLPA
jgi:hypothetical protein